MAKKGGAAGKDEDGFPKPEECIMIFGGSDAIWTKRQHKVCYREACAIETAVVGVWPLVSIRQDMGRTIRGGPAHKIKACTTLLDVHRKLLYITK